MAHRATTTQRVPRLGLLTDGRVVQWTDETVVDHDGTSHTRVTDGRVSIPQPDGSVAWQVVEGSELEMLIAMVLHPL